MKKFLILKTLLLLAPTASFGFSFDFYTIMLLLKKAGFGQANILTMNIKQDNNSSPNKDLPDYFNQCDDVETCRKNMNLQNKIINKHKETIEVQQSSIKKQNEIIDNQDKIIKNTKKLLY